MIFRLIICVVYLLWVNYCRTYKYFYVMLDLLKILIIVILLIFLVPLLWALVKLFVFFIGGLLFDGLGYALFGVICIVFVIFCLKFIFDWLTFLFLLYSGKFHYGVSLFSFEVFYFIYSRKIKRFSVDLMMFGFHWNLYRLFPAKIKIQEKSAKSNPFC